jgi:hypothetical protein
MTNYHPFNELLKTRMREFFREPETIFWVYAFPVLLAISLGVAFRNRPAERVFVDIQQQVGAEAVAGSLKKLPDFAIAIHPRTECLDRNSVGEVCPGRHPGRKDRISL